ncbi:MAG: hypothetical protein AAFY20_05165 [Cyanobacteria bacterium J06639_14]
MTVLEMQQLVPNGQLGKGDYRGAIASGAAGTPSPTAPPLGKGRTGNVTVLEMQQLVPNGQLIERRDRSCRYRSPISHSGW